MSNTEDHYEAENVFESEEGGWHSVEELGLDILTLSEEALEECECLLILTVYYP